MLAAAIVALASPAPVAGGGILTLIPSFGHPGDTVIAHGQGYLQNTPISVLWDVGLIASGNSGSAAPRIGFDIPFVVPPGASLGSHVVTVCEKGSGATECEPGGASDTAPFTVVLIAQTPTPAPSLPPPPTPIPGASATAAPTLPFPTFPLGGETPSPEPPPIAVVTPAPTPPNQVGDIPEDFPDLWIKAIEVTQGIQDLQNRMPLVEDRRTYARVHVGVIGQPDQANTHGVLEARRNGQQIGWIWAENGPILAKLGGGSRAQADDSLNFRLPQAWLHGEITLRAFVYSYSLATVFEKEAEWQNNLLDVEVAFHSAQPLTVHLAPLHMHRSFHPDDVERTYDSDLDADLLPPGGSATLRILNGLYRYHPLAQVNLDLLTAPVTPLDHEDGHEFNMGGCQTTLVEWAFGAPELTDWEPLKDDPANLDPVEGVSYDADNKFLAILDRRVEVDHWYLTETGGAQVYGDQTDHSGPIPLPGTPVFVGGCKPEPSTSAEANQTLAMYRVFYDWDEEEDLFVGMVHPSLPTLFGGQSSSGTDSVWVSMSDSFGYSVSTWHHSGAATLAHEAGHAAGLKHVPCKDGDEDTAPDGVPDELAGGAIDLSHPNALTFPNCSLADVDPEGWYWFDVYWPLFGLDGPVAVSNNPDQAQPSRGFPLLSYAGPKASDPYHYCRLLDFYGVPCDPTDLGIPWSEPDAPAGGPLTSPPNPEYDELPPGASGLIGLQGSLDPTTGSGSLEGAFFLEDPTPTAMRQFSGQYVVAEVTHKVVVLDAAGNELASVPVQNQDTSHEADNIYSFKVMAPAFAQAHVYQLRSTDYEFARLEVSPNAPVLTWGSLPQETDAYGRVKVQFHWDREGKRFKPLFAFTTVDLDNDPLDYTILYAPDGEHWQVLAAGLTEPSHEVYLDTLPGGDRPTIQVIAFDGTRASTLTAEPILPEGAKPGLPPVVVLGDYNSYEFPSGAPVTLEATAFDAEDRTMPGDAIAWSSSIDGDLGSGSELVVDDLSAGTHTVSATVTDSDGLAATSSFELEIDGSVIQPKPDPAVEAAMDAIFAAVAAGEDPATAYQDTTTPFGEVAPWLILVGIAAAAAGGAFLVWRSRSGHKFE